MDQYKQNRKDLSLKAKTDKYPKLICFKRLSLSDGVSASSYGSEFILLDSAEGLLTSIILFISEFCCMMEERPIVSWIYRCSGAGETAGIQGNNNSFTILAVIYLPDNLKQRWFAGACFEYRRTAMMSVLFLRFYHV